MFFLLCSHYRKLKSIAWLTNQWMYGKVDVFECDQLEWSYGDKEVVHIVEERKLSPYSNLDFNLDVFIDISIDWNTRISLYIFVCEFFIKWFLVFANYLKKIQIASCYDFSTSKLINILHFYFAFFMKVSIYGHLTFFLKTFM